MMAIFIGVISATIVAVWDIEFFVNILHYLRVIFTA